jgi:predicted DCC family thiol-disulfide oxidoreductase YuxK
VSVASAPATNAAPAAGSDAAHILFFDGECGFCNRAIRFTMERDVSGRIRVAALAGETASRELVPFRSMLADVDSVVLYRPAAAGREAAVLIHSDAALAVLRLLGGGWAVLGAAGHIVPRWIRDVAYKAFARRRFRLFGRVEACQLWPAEWRARVLP